MRPPRLLPLYLLLPGLLASLAASAEWFSDQQAIMGTSVSVTLWHEDKVRGPALTAAVMAEMRRIDAALSPYKPDSELARVNALAATAAQPLSDELLLLLRRSAHYSRLSDGAFDITFASVGHLYNYRDGRQPEAAEKQALLPAIDYRHVQLDEIQHSVRFAHPNVKIDLGGIAKGYAVDRAIELLQAAGVAHATVSAGGDSRVLGDKRGRPWIVGIKNPRQQPGEAETVIRMPLSDTAISTSGDYERFFIGADGQRIHHILNPRTGDSAQGVVSVTILGARGVDTDPLSTTVFVLGVAKGLALVNSLPDFDCVIIDNHGNAHYSSGLSAPNVN